MGSDGIAVRETARPAAAGAVDVQADVVVVGGGGGGLPAALFSRWLGDEVVLLEKAPELGGTARKAAFWYWVPHNEPMTALGIEDPEEDFLRYCARLSRPESYDADSPTLGLSAWELDADPRDLRERLAGRGAAGRARRAALPPLRGGPRLLGGAARGQGPDRPRARAGRRPRVDVRRRAERHPHAERRGGARRRRRADRAPRAARHHRRRRGRRRRGDDGGRVDGARRRAQGRRVRLRRLHPRPRAAGELPLRAGLRRLRGGHERGRPRAHRGAARRAAAQHEQRVDVPDPAREGPRARPGARRDVLRRRGLDALRRQGRAARRQREAAVQRARPGVLPLGPAGR